MLGLARICACIGLTVVGASALGADAYRTLAPLCLPCGAESHVAIGSSAKLEQVHASLKKKCGEAKSPADWRKQVEREKLDFSREALVVMYEVIGTGGKATLEVRGPADGVLAAAIRWQTPKGPALPIATAACFSFAVDKVVVRRVDIRAGGVLNRDAKEAVKMLDISR